MASCKITYDIYSVGILNPAMRIFDVVMRTDFGTTYNSFIVKGSEKTALIEVSHATYFEHYLNNIKEVCDPAEIDYIVLNHCEPDHSGALASLLSHCPKATIVVSRAGSIYLKNITNCPDLNMQVAKDGDTIDLGGKTLSIINAPFLHWPDSMFTWCPEEKTLFPCDMFGAHYCEPYVFDYNTVYPDKYEIAFKGYYDAIFGPFKPYVLSGLDKIKALDIQRICTSHGPVITKQGRLDYVMEQYRIWSTPAPKEKKQIPLFYCSAYGNTRIIAHAIRDGIREVLPEAACETYDLNKHELGDMAALLNSADAFCVGSPTLNADAVAPIWMLLAHVDAINSKKKPVLVFGSYGWSGEAVPNLTARLNGLKMNVFGDGLKIVFVPSEEDLAAAKALGRQFAQSI